MIRLPTARPAALAALVVWAFLFSPRLARADVPTRSASPAAAAPGTPATPTGVSDVRDAIARALEFTVTIEGGGIYGSGILMSPSAGLVLTAGHVVEEMKGFTITFFDGRSVPGKVIEIDRALDLALVQIPAQPGPPPRLGDATRLRPGEEIYAVGCPRHLGFTVSRGIVSYAGRTMDGARYVQTDLPINDGNSGGPVVNQGGEVVGVMSFILRRAQGLSFALPVNYAVERFAHAIVPPDGDPGYLARFRVWRGDGGGTLPLR